MDTAKIFENGRSQAVRLPEAYRFSGNDLFIKNIDDVIMFIPKDKVWKIFRESLSKLYDDITFTRDNDVSQTRESL